MFAKKYIIMLVFIALSVSCWAAGAGATSGPKPLKPEQAKQAFNGSAADRNIPTTIQATPVSPAEVAAVAALPGAQVEGSPSPKMASPVTADSADVATTDYCWTFAWNLSAGFGTWPYDRYVYEYRYYCAHGIGGPQYYRVSYVQGNGSIPKAESTYQLRYSGGNGYTWTTVESGVYFTARTNIPFFDLHEWDWMRWSCNTWGNCARVDRGSR